MALQDSDGDALDRTAGAIRGRSARVANVVTAEMDNYEPGIYTERVLEAIKVLRDQGIVWLIEVSFFYSSIKTYYNQQYICSL